MTMPLLSYDIETGIQIIGKWVEVGAENSIIGNNEVEDAEYMRTELDTPQEPNYPPPTINLFPSQWK